VAALVCAQLIVAYAAQVSTVGVGEIPLLNAASGLFLTGGTVLLLVSAGFEVSRVVADLAADY
jgi:transketolase C-terminal domain/subunit